MDFAVGVKGKRKRRKTKDLRRYENNYKATEKIPTLFRRKSVVVLHRVI